MFIKRLSDENAYEHEKLASQAFVFPYDEKEGGFTFGISGGDVFEVSWSDGKAEVMRSKKQADITADSAAAAKLLLSGVRSIRELAYEPGVELNGNAEDFVRAFTMKNIFFCDSF